MKVILSRKGFDSRTGGKYNPILPDGTLLSFPIPDARDAENYSGLAYNGIEYSQLLQDLGYNGIWSCHLDPDIRANIRKTPVANWQPAFGQIDKAQGYLDKAGVTVNDIFLFFGCFKNVVLKNGHYKYVRKNSRDFYIGHPIQIIFGYFQIGQIVKVPAEIQNYHWHPHAAEHRLENATNALYIPTERLSFNPDLPGSGVLNYAKRRILTKEGCTPAKWAPKDFLMPDCIVGNRKNSGEAAELYYKGQWQELVINESEALRDWVKDVINSYE